MSTSSSVGFSSPVRSTTSPPNYLFNESIFAELDNSLWIISRPLGNLPWKTSLLVQDATLQSQGVCTGPSVELQQGGSADRKLQKHKDSMGSNLLSVSVTCHACGEKGHYKTQCSLNLQTTGILVARFYRKLTVYESLYHSKKEFGL
ncbi:reverse transcriptase domain-containing protein [Tanacetum coccineum]